MKQVHCPNCKALLFKAEFANIEIACRKCGRLVKIQFYTSTSLILTTDSKKATIKLSERSKEVIEPGSPESS